MAPRGRNNPVTPDDEARITDLHARGLSRNAIARETGWSAGTITTVCNRLGLPFDRSNMKAATQARKADAAQLRAELEVQLLEDAQKLRAQVWQPHQYRSYGGKDHTLRKWTQDEPQAVDKLKLMQAAGIALDRSIKLATVDKGGEIDEAKSMMGRLLEQLQVAAGEYDEAIAS